MDTYRYIKERVTVSFRLAFIFKFDSSLKHHTVFGMSGSKSS